MVPRFGARNSAELINMTKQSHLEPRIAFLIFAVTWLVIIAVAGFDSYLTVKHSPIMDEVEMNPVGAMVLRSTGGVPLLIGLKTAGVALALLFSMALWQWERLRAKVLFSTTSVATLAIGMVGFMHVDTVGMQTRSWAKETSAGQMATHPSSNSQPRKQKPNIPLSSTNDTNSGSPNQSQVVQAIQPVHIGSLSS
jgi:hypothetical protein